MNKINFITKALPEPASTAKMRNEYLFSILLENEADIENIYLTGIHHNNSGLVSCSNFSICIKFGKANAPNEELLTSLIRNKNKIFQLFFHPNFEKKENTPVVFVNCEDADESYFNRLFTTFELIVCEQGFDSIEMIQLNKSNTNFNHQKQMLYECRDGQAFKDWYYAALTKDFYIFNYLGLVNHSDLSIDEFMELKLSVENDFKNSHPRLHSFALQSIVLNSKISVIEAELKQTKEDLENQKTYLRIIKQQDETLKIKKFYYNEYETLPLWYKRFGHVLKVVTGKRTFRSLFDNNVNKYKD